MKYLRKFALFLLLISIGTIFISSVPAEAKKKKLWTAVLLGALLGSRQKMMPLPLPLPIPLPIKHEKVIPFPEPYHYPVYVNHYGGGGGGEYGGHGGGGHYEHYGGGGGGGGGYAAASSFVPQYAIPPTQYGSKFH